MQTQVELNAAQAAIYTRTNLSRAFQDFDDTDIGGIYLRGDDCLVVRRDGSEQAYNRELIKASFNTYTHRLKDSFPILVPIIVALVYGTTMLTFFLKAGITRTHSDT
jgi:hypothetical protein